MHALKSTHHVILAFLTIVMAKSFATFSSGQARIVGGQNAVEGRYPYMVSLQSGSFHECGAVVVAPDVVLTAAHCAIDDIDKAVLGRFDLKDANETDSQVIDIMYYMRHPDYNSAIDRYDLGLYKLMELTNLPPIVMNQNQSLLMDGMNLTVMGFGDLGNDTYPNILQEVQVNYIPNDPCRNYEDPWGEGESYKYYIYKDMMCALGDGKDGCYGDSGGPLVVRGDTYEEDVLVGLTSWGLDCARLPGVYARVDTMYDWISETVCRVSGNPPAYLQCPATPPSPKPTKAPTLLSPAPVVTSKPTSVDGNRDDSLSSTPTTRKPITWPPQIAVTPTLTDDIKSGDVRLCWWVTCMLLPVLTSTLLLNG